MGGIIAAILEAGDHHVGAGMGAGEATTRVPAARLGYCTRDSDLESQGTVAYSHLSAFTLLLNNLFSLMTEYTEFSTHCGFLRCLSFFSY